MAECIEKPEESLKKSKRRIKKCYLYKESESDSGSGRIKENKVMSKKLKLNQS